MRIHLVGVGGVAMGNLAAMLKSIGHTVTGSDKALYPPMSDKLKDWGIEARPFDSENISGAELCVIGNAISRGNVEVEEILNRRVRYTSMASALHEFFLKDKDVICVAGTHGKTTTTFLIDHLLSESDRPPGLFVGGVRADGMEGFRVSDSPYFVIEGDEYDTAFFDKSSKFLHYRPRYLILTSLEYDHADIYPNEKLYRWSFERLLRMIPSQGLVVACTDDSGVRAVLDGFDLAPLVAYSGKPVGKDNDRKSKSRRKSDSSKDQKKKQKDQFQAEVVRFERTARQVTFPFTGTVDDFAMIGAHNTANALAATEVGRRLELSPEKVARALQTFPGVLRRQQIRVKRTAGSNRVPILFIEDFAHHPTAVAATIDAVREAYPDLKLHALYEPRSATSHRSVFQKRYVRAFQRADSVHIVDIFNKKKVNREEQLDAKQLVRDLSKKTVARFHRTPEELVAYLEDKFSPSKKGDVVLAMSNGAFGGIYPRIDALLDRHADAD